MSVGILRKCEPRKLIVNRKIAMNKFFFLYFYLRRITVTTRKPATDDLQEVQGDAKYMQDATHVYGLFRVVYAA